MSRGLGGIAGGGLNLVPDQICGISCITISRLWSNGELNSPTAHLSGLTQAVSLYYLALGAYILSSTKFGIFFKKHKISLNKLREG